MAPLPSARVGPRAGNTYLGAPSPSLRPATGRRLLLLSVYPGMTTHSSELGESLLTARSASARGNLPHTGKPELEMTQARRTGPVAGRFTVRDELLLAA